MYSGQLKKIPSSILSDLLEHGRVWMSRAVNQRGRVTMAELNLKQITDKLNAEFAGESRKLVFLVR